jgi:predicted phosphodiesterase
MRIAVIADIHANYHALEAVLDRIEALRVTMILCLGDVVGYGANPNKCVDLVRAHNIQSVMGNHDACAVGLEEPDGFNPLAKNALYWTREHLTEENSLFLMGLPRAHHLLEFYLFHGSIDNLNRYILGKQDAQENFLLLAKLPDGPGIGFFGHTHVRTAYSLGATGAEVEESPELFLSPDKRYLINPGSVGQPRDGDPRAAFLVYDDHNRQVTFYRVAYDVNAC